MEPSKTGAERKQQIAEAIFDRFARIHFLNLDEPKNKLKAAGLGAFARRLGYDVDSLKKTILVSSARINGDRIAPQQTQKDEMKILLAIAEFEIKETYLPLKFYKRELNDRVKELNRQNIGLKLKTKEIFYFVYPLYIKILKEEFSFKL